MIDVIIIEDDPEYRNELFESIDNANGFNCINAFNDCESAIRCIKDDPPDVVLMDIQLPGMSGIEGVLKIKQILDEINIIMLTNHIDDELIYNSLLMGACGYLQKNVDDDRLLSLIEDVYNGISVMGMAIGKKVKEYLEKQNTNNNLNEREQQILEKICDGKNNKIIGLELYISVATVKYHIKKIYEKLYVNNRVSAVRKAIEGNLIERILK